MLHFQNASQTFGTYLDIWKGKFVISRMIDVGVFLLDQSAVGVERAAVSSSSAQLSSVQFSSVPPLHSSVL